MSTTIEAVYEGGVFRPTRQVSLTEGTHVEVIVPTDLPARDPKAVASRLARIADKAVRGGQTDSASRDHDKFLYGETSNQ
ncbi:MAG: antitoxin family protein [Pirellulales bacterium]|nr:antitoxin family protein [Pirellulales bacterium]